MKGSPAPLETGGAAGLPDGSRVRSRLPRDLHPGAWWLWALGMAAAASRTTNLLLLGLILAVVSLVVAARRGAAPWARGFKYYLWMALFVVGLRVVFRVLLDAGVGTTVLFTLPEVPLPEVAAGIRLGGVVTAEAVLSAVREGMRLATLIICVGAANALANPKRLLAAVPPALHEVAVAVTVGLSVAPQLVESAQRVHRARRLRGESGRRRHVLRDVLVPVASDALDRSLMLAASMSSRGHGRLAGQGRAARRGAVALVLGGMLALCAGAYAWLDATVSRPVAMAALVAGTAAGVAGMVLSGRRVVRTRYRPDPWAAEEWAVAACGVLAATGMFLAPSRDPLALDPSPNVLAWPQLPLVALVSVLLGALPAVLAPPVQPRDAHRSVRAAAGSTAPEVGVS